MGIMLDFVGPVTGNYAGFCWTSDWELCWVFVGPVTGNYAGFVGPVIVFMLVLSDQQLLIYAGSVRPVTFDLCWFCQTSDCHLCWFYQTSDRWWFLSDQ